MDFIDYLAIIAGTQFLMCFISVLELVILVFSRKD